MATVTKRKHKHVRIRGQKFYASDVDETLVIIDNIPEGIDESTLVKICINPNKPDAWCWAMRHERHIDMMRKMAARGFTIVVWSAGGEEWANYVVELLGLEGLVDVTMSKFDWFAD